MSIADRIRSKLSAALQPERLEIVDESDLHVGHAGARPEGESHFRITIVSRAFEGQPRVQRQRTVYQLLGEELRDGLHALALITRTPSEDS